MIIDLDSIKSSLHEVATQTYTLAMGLQNAALSSSAAGPSKSVQYLLEISVHIEKASKQIDELAINKPNS